MECRSDRAVVVTLRRVRPEAALLAALQAGRSRATRALPTPSARAHNSSIMRG
jgi:hypothetical protein